ncbi:hypothetical protein PHLCEN_2v7909 [Hermanssonia centrifuga]|uniref:C2H2-type domain-containing protein n=1 Tax=Hermanssonia centrifuga TaxID=98765 RepID=A0A2R6NVX5_9APHY|nr:hypothetical protein PHLCEN_2v7909 [Hermanssonia centrifuga]
MTGRDVNELAVRLDKNRVITNPARLICGPDGSYPGPTVVTTRANERSWNGDAYECILCHRTFRSLSALNAHLNSPAHADKIFRCPRGFSGCGSEFKTLSGLMQHVESGSCGVHRFQKRVNRALDDITQGIRGITF